MSTGAGVMSKMMCLRNEVVPAEQMMCLRNDVPLRGNAGDGSIQNALRDALGILSGKTFQQSKGLLQNIKGERR